jgi:hypothetical protein
MSVLAGSEKHTKMHTKLNIATDQQKITTAPGPLVFCSRVQCVLWKIESTVVLSEPPMLAARPTDGTLGS